MLTKEIEVDGCKFKIRSLTWQEQKNLAKAALKYALLKSNVNIDLLPTEDLFYLFTEVISLTDDDLKQKLQNIIKEWFI